MRIYESATIVEDHLSGFQSPASEFAEKPLSFDERYGLGNKGLISLIVNVSNPKLGIYKNDQLLVDLGKKPGPKSLVVTFMDDETRIFQGSDHSQLEGIMCGVVTVIVRDYYSKS